MAAEYGKELCEREYHVYNNVWEAVAGETLVCVREPRNAHDRYAVAVEKDGTIIRSILPDLGVHGGTVGLVRSTLLFALLRDLLH